jgi:hypothetical protein
MYVHIQILCWGFSLKCVDTLKLILRCVAKVRGYILILYGVLPLKCVHTLNSIVKYFTKVLHTCQFNVEALYLKISSEIAQYLK